MTPLPEQARRMVGVAKKLLVTRGYRQLTLEAIGSECGLNKIAVKYYFGNKAGLMNALLDSLVYDSCFVVARLVAETLQEPRYHAFFDAKCQWSQSDEQFAFIELLPHILRDSHQREQLSAMYERLISDYEAFLSVYFPHTDAESRRGLAQLVIGVVDGLAIQYRMDKERFSIVEPFQVLEAAIAAWLTRQRDLDTVPAAT